MKNEILANIINFDKRTIKNKETGEVTIMYSVNFAVNTDSYKDHYGPTILTSYCSESSFNLLNSKLGKTVKVELSEKPLFGRNNAYKKVVSKIDGVDIRQF